MIGPFSHVVIHPTAIIDPTAQLASDVEVGPYAVIEAGVEMGPGCMLGPYVHLAAGAKIGAHNRFFTGCVIGEAPQDLKYDGAPSTVRIGDYNTFREHVTVHRANKPREETLVGSHNLLMAHCHVAHNCEVGNRVIIANGALLGGHVQVGDRALISGNCLVHQFTRVGTLALMQGGSAISKDLPPYTIARGDNGICGLNVIGLRRAGMAAAERLELRRLYHALFRQGTNLSRAVAAAREVFKSKPSLVMLDFLSASERGVCADRGQRELERDEPAG